MTFCIHVKSVIEDHTVFGCFSKE